MSRAKESLEFRYQLPGPLLVTIYGQGSIAEVNLDRESNSFFLLSFLVERIDLGLIGRALVIDRSYVHSVLASEVGASGAVAWLPI